MSASYERRLRLYLIVLFGTFFLLSFPALLWIYYSPQVRLTPETRDGLQPFLMGYAVAGLGFWAYVFVHTVRQAGQTSATLSEGTTPEVPWMIQTFEGLIARLKEKEKVLEELRRVAEERVLHVESDNENILQSVTSGVVTLDSTQAITRLNAAAGRILHIEPAAAVGQHYSLLFGSDLDLAALLSTSGVDRRRECLVPRADGTPVWIGLTASPLRNQRKTVIGTTIVFTDLTEIKALQEQVELKQRLALMGEMSAWIAHEFRNDLGTIFGFSKLLEKQMGPDHPVRESLSAIHRSITRMERLITEMLAYAKTSEIQPFPVSLDNLLRDLVDQAKAGSPEIEWHLALQEISVTLDPVLIRQAFSNLIHNAIEAMGGTGRITIRVDRTPDGAVRVEIADSGPGIPPEHLSRIFLPFFTTKEAGTGLGLALAHKMVLAHNGRISVENRREGGASFTVDLPLSSGQQVENRMLE